MASASRKVSALDVAQAGSMAKLITQLAEQVRSGTMEVKEKSVQLLRSLTDPPASGAARVRSASEEADNAVLIAQSAGIKPLIALLVAGSPVAQAHACATLANIASGRPQYQELIIKEGGVLPLATILRMGDVGTQTFAAAVIASISERVDSHEVILKAGGVPSLVSLLRNCSAETGMMAAQALGNLAKDSPDGQRAAQRAGAIPLLVELLGSVPKSQAAAAHALSRLTQDSVPNQNEVTKLGGIPKLLNLLNGVNDGAQASAAAALAALASGARATHFVRALSLDESTRSLMADAGAIAQLVRWVCDGSDAAAENALIALAQLALVGAPRRAEVCNHLVALQRGGADEKTRQRAASGLQLAGEAIGDADESETAVGLAACMFRLHGR